MSVVEPHGDFQSCGEFFFFFSRTLEKLGRTLELCERCLTGSEAAGSIPARSLRYE